MCRDRRAGTRSSSCARPAISLRMLRRMGFFRCVRSRGSDGGKGFGSGSYLGRSAILRRRTVVRSSGSHHCWLPVPASLSSGAQAGSRRRAMALAAHRPDHQGRGSRARFSRKRARDRAAGFAKRVGRSSSNGFPRSGRLLLGGRSWRAAPSAEGVRIGLPRQRPTRKPQGADRSIRTGPILERR